MLNRQRGNVQACRDRANRLEILNVVVISMLALDKSGGQDRN